MVIFSNWAAVRLEALVPNWIELAPAKVISKEPSHFWVLLSVKVSLLLPLRERVNVLPVMARCSGPNACSASLKFSVLLPETVNLSIGGIALEALKFTVDATREIPLPDKADVLFRFITPELNVNKPVPEAIPFPEMVVFPSSWLKASSELLMMLPVSSVMPVELISVFVSAVKDPLIISVDGASLAIRVYAVGFALLLDITISELMV